jgi:putative glutamine amidotransferase
MAARPWVAVVADRIESGGRQEQRVAQKYLEPLWALAGVEPVLLPAREHEADIARLLQRCEGICLTGARSNLHPRHYAADDTAIHEPLDPARDATALCLAAAAVAHNLPLLGICRGLQELNVALGGSLHPALHQVPGRLDHRAPDAPAHARHAVRHAVHFTAGGLLARLTGLSGCQVNSLHGQGIDRLGHGLVVEAAAPDGTIEAVSLPGHPFLLALQWHLEHEATTNPVSRAVYHAFGAALRGEAPV